MKAIKSYSGAQCHMSAQPWYVCSKCGKNGIKLWRNYQTTDFELECAACLGVVDQLDDQGKIKRSGLPGRTDQVKGKVPAAPCKDSVDSAFWGYTSVPDDDVTAWTRLPNK